MKTVCAITQHDFTFQSLHGSVRQSCCVNLIQLIEVIGHRATQFSCRVTPHNFPVPSHLGYGVIFS